ncbi:hypothetical protein [Halovulum marinum]|uniref:hypothetical protein n=1 Tax=Halovulum marinum TaxID=2662447 RepID=UPI0012B18C1E|nr:hypothetical protein [Halovulum marinum]
MRPTAPGRFVLYVSLIAALAAALTIFGLLPVYVAGLGGAKLALIAYGILLAGVLVRAL